MSLKLKYLELLMIFILIPISFWFSYNIFLKIAICALGFVYILYVLFKIEKTKIKISKNLQWKKFLKNIAIKLILIIIITTIFVWFSDKESLFYVALNKPKLWIFILFVYSFFSVYPQEIIYRTFFFKRYKELFKNDFLLIITNALLFSFAHLFFKNILVLILTFLGGIIFAITYNKTKSTLLASIEHAVYGCWLFTVGMGNMLGFPS